MDLKELGRVDPSTHWYYQTKKIPLLRYFESTAVSADRQVDIIDVGAGSGFFALELLRQYPSHVSRVILVDDGYTDRELGQLDAAIIRQREVPAEVSLSFILLMDVLEHIEKDREFLYELRARVVGKSNFFITVPAFPSLWSAHDVFLGHYRRYRLKEFGALLSASGFGITSLYYFYGSIFPLAWLVRKLKPRGGDGCDLRPLPRLVDSYLQQIVSIEVYFRRFNKLFGLSCVAEGSVGNS